MTDSARDRIAVIIGSGAMGVAAARRFGPACHLLVADNSQARLEAAVRSLTDDGHHVEAMTVDVRDGEAVAAVAAAAGRAGTVMAVIHTAGVSPGQGSARDIFAINLVGTAHVIGEAGIRGAEVEEADAQQLAGRRGGQFVFKCRVDTLLVPRHAGHADQRGAR